MVNIIYTGKDFKVGFITPSASSIPADSTAITAILLPEDSRLSTYNIKNNLRRVYNLGQRNYADVATMKFEGALTLDMPLYNEEQLQIPFDKSGSSYIVGTPKTDFVVDIPGDDIRYVWQFIPTSFGLTIREEDVVRVSVEGNFVKEAIVVPGTDSGTGNPNLTLNGAEAGQYATHIQAHATTFSGVSDWQVKSVDLRFNLNNEFKWGIGSRFIQGVAPKGIEGSADIEIVFDEDFLKKLYGSDTATSPADVVSTIDNIVFTVSTASRTYTITLSNAYIDEIDAPIQPNEETTMRLRLLVGDVTITVA